VAARADIDPRRLLAAVAAALSCLALFFWISGRDAFFLPTDIAYWYQDSLWLKACRSRPWTVACPELSKFPLGYLMNSVVLQRLGPDPRAALQLLQSAALSLPAAGLVAASVRLRHGCAQAGLYALLIVLTPLPAFYLRSGALEVQAGVFLGLALLFGLRQLRWPGQAWPWLSNACVLVGCLYKDSLAPTFALAVLLAAVPSRSGRAALPQLARLWGPGLVGAGLASLVWNLTRYRSLLPLGYLEEASLNRPSPSQALFSLWGLFLSPNGGFVAFWGAAFAVLLALSLARRRWTPAWPDFAERLPLLLLLLGVSSMAFWWAPFGWVAWGARLSVPFALAALIAALGELEPPRRPGSRSCRGGWDRRRAVTAGLALLLAALLLSRSLPYVALGYRPDRGRFFAPSPATAVAAKGGVQPAGRPAPSCTQRILAEMATQPQPHPNPLVRMWRTEAYWPCVEQGLRADPARS
jgi:hypothetical protein